MAVRKAVGKLGITPALLFLVGIGLVSSLTKPTSIKLVNNAYSGIVVGIHRDVKENQNLINIIKDMFIEGSLYLYNATKQRAYFHNVTILIPKTWTPRPEYRQASNESYDLADVIVAPPNPRWAPDPYTKQYQGCGKEGVHIHFWDLFLLEPDIEDYYGPLGRVLVHEWGHYRWGLFDEYADPVGDPDNYQEFYYNYITKEWEGVRCSYDYNGVPLKFFHNLIPYYRPCSGNSTVGYEDGCVYVTLQDGHKTTGSIMFGRQYFDQIVDFCDNNPFDRPNLHNREAPNKHNRLCDYRSAWEVMRQTSDFEDENNSPRDIDPSELIPEFILVQHEEIRVVLVLDVSESMLSNEKFLKMLSSAANYISSIVVEGSMIGLVEFQTTSNILSQLIRVESDDDRQALLDALPTRFIGSTCIGCGLLDALDVLQASETDPAGGIILLLSDGEENESPYIDDVKDDLIAAGVIVDTIAFTQDAERALYELAVLTGGTPYYYSNEPGDNTLYDAFAATMERGEVDDYDRRVQLIGNSWMLNGGESRSESVFLDYTIGRRTEFTFQWTTLPIALDTYVTLPNGTVLDSSYDGYGVDLTFRIITYKILGIAQPGSWSFTLTNPNPSQSEEVFLTVTSYATDPNVEPILVTSELSGSLTDFQNGEPIIAYAEVRQGFSPIIYAEVWARVDRPGNYDPVDIQLLDNGAGADITKYDGVYSRYFTQFTEAGFYGIKVTVVNNGTAIVLGNRPVSRAIPNLPPEEGDNPPKVGNDTVRPPWNPPSEPTGDPAPKFTRGLSGGSSSVPEVPPGYDPDQDYIAPGRIIDLRVSETSFEEATVTLSWSASGDDLDSGTAQYYDIRRTDTIPELQDNFFEADPINQSDLVIGDLNAPQEFGNIETFVIKVPIDENATLASYAFAVQVWDDAIPPYSSNVSNIVQATFRKYIPPAEPPPTGLPSTSTSPTRPQSTGLPKTSPTKTSPTLPPGSGSPPTSRKPPYSTFIPIPPVADKQFSIGAIIAIAVGSMFALALLVGIVVGVIACVISAQKVSKTPDLPLTANNPPSDKPPNYYENPNT